MRWIINLFREKKVLGNDGVLAGSDQFELEQLKKKAVIKHLRSLRASSPAQAESQASLIRLSYWGERDRASRCLFEIETHYQSFFQDNRFIGTAMVLALYGLLVHLMQSKSDHCTDKSSELLIQWGGVIILFWGLESLAYLNYREEETKLKNAKLTAMHTARSDGAILTALGYDQWLEERPEATKESLKPV